MYRPTHKRLIGLRSGCMQSVLVVSAWVFSQVLLAQQSAPTEQHPNKIQFRRQAVKRIVFDSEQAIPLAGLDPTQIISLDLMHPELITTADTANCEIQAGSLRIASAGKSARSRRWLGAFNPFATYDLSIQAIAGTGACGLVFQDLEHQDELSAGVEFKDGKPTAIVWTANRDGVQRDRQNWAWPDEVKLGHEPIVLRAQMSAVGVNLFIQANGVSQLIGFADFSQHFDLREKSRLIRYRSAISAHLQPHSSVEITSAAAALTPGVGQADLRAITDEQGVPLLEDGRLWFTITLRGRALPHPTQGVFSLNPTVFDLKFEGMIVFDMGDGLWRNELASHLFRDTETGQWRGWTTGFSAFGTKSEKESKTILAVWSAIDPRRGFNVMQARPVGIDGAHEDPHCVFDADVRKWRMLLCEHGKNYEAAMWESDDWDRGYKRIAGPIGVDSTGTLIQKFGDTRYALFGSADRVIYVRSYPDLQPVGELKMDLPPWNDSFGTRIWPNVVPLPEGYPAPYIALMMDRANFPGMPKPNWTYGAMYLYHGYPVEN